MRTVIFMGLIYVGDAIGGGSVFPNNDAVAFYTIIFIFAAIMDIADFFRPRHI